jgi:hypothetical protein
MRRAPFALLVAVGTLSAVKSAEAHAQVTVQVGLSFVWSDGGWHAYRSAYEPVVREVYYSAPREVVFHAQRRALKVPRGHLPPPGMCRAWYPGRPPGHQPPAGPCDVLFRTVRHPGAVIIGTPTFFAADGRFWFGDGRGSRFDDDRSFRRSDDARRFRIDDDRGFRVVEDRGGFRLVSVDDDFDDRRGRRGKR